MIEIIQEGQAKPAVKLPRNLRQIGSPGETHKIYVEDFVYTFLHPIKEEETGNIRAAILVGKKEKEKNVLYYFVKGAFYIEEIGFEKGIPQFTEEIWGFIYKTMKEYFDDEDPEKSMQILGWTYVTGGMAPRLTSDIERVHRMNFKETDTLLLLLDDVEREENFYAYEKGSLRKKEGYYIFYEQNPQMQEYMVQYREKMNPSKEKEIEVDEVAKSYRAKIGAGEYGERKHWTKIGYAACALFFISVLVMGINSIGSYEKIEQLQETVSMIAGNFEKKNKDEKQNTTDEDNLVVTTVKGEVEPLEETTEVSAEGISAEDQKDGQEEKPEESQNQEEQKEAKQPEQQEQNEIGEASAPAPTEAEIILAQGYYIVASGDSLESISTKIYGNTSRVSRIKEINQIENADTIFVGQKLILP